MVEILVQLEYLKNFSGLFKEIRGESDRNYSVLANIGGRAEKGKVKNESTALFSSRF